MKKELMKKELKCETVVGFIVFVCIPISLWIDSVAKLVIESKFDYASDMFRVGFGMLVCGAYIVIRLVARSEHLEAILKKQEEVEEVEDVTK